MLQSASKSISSQVKKSIFHFCRDDNGEEEEDTRSSTKKRKLPFIMNNKDANENPAIPTTRMMLQGPSQCGKTSLLMDVAYDIVRMNGNVDSAKTDEDEDEDEEDEGNRSERDEDDNDDETTMKKPIVTFLTPTKNQSQILFPLICSPSLSPNSNNIINQSLDKCKSNTKNNDSSNISSMSQFTIQQQNFEQQMHELENQQRNLNSSHYESKKRRRKNGGKVSHNQWNVQDHGQRLQRIQIKYIDSIHDLMKYLASIHCATKQKAYSTSSMRRKKKQQVQCIIIDDLDYFIKDCDDDTTLTSSSINQINHEDRNHHHRHHDSVINKSLFLDDMDDDDDQNYNNDSSYLLQNKGVEQQKKKANQVASTIEMMRLVQLLAHISDVCNHLNRNNIESSFYTCINTDNLSIPKHYIGLLQNYTSTIATISPATIDDKGIQSISSVHMEHHHQQFHQRQQHLAYQKFSNNTTVQKLFNMDQHDKESMNNSLSMTFLANQISSVWHVHIEHNHSKDWPLHINPLDLQKFHQYQQRHGQKSFYCNVVYAVIWTYDQFNDFEDSDYYHSDGEDIDYDAKEIVWKLI